MGGIAASLMHDQFVREPRWAGVRFISGLLDGPPATALNLSVRDGDFGADDLSGQPIEERTPDYGILDDIEYIYPVNDAYFGYASRGCVRKCAFCGVPKLEGAQREMPPLGKLVRAIADLHGAKKDLILMDNNVTASARYAEVIAEIRDLGFERGATLQREGRKPIRRRVDFNQGVDARILVKTQMYLREMAKICISPLRIAFDHIGLRRVYEKAVCMAADHGITSLSNYMLYNFMDNPADLYERMRLNIALNAQRRIRIWSFPMRYQPVTLKDRSHVGKNWNRYFLRSFQIMLQATRGVVSGNEPFFVHAYGHSAGEFSRLLSLPHAFIFHRQYYEAGGEGAGVRAEYESMRNRISTSQERELIGLLSDHPYAAGLSRGYYDRIIGDLTVDKAVRDLMAYHTIDPKDREGENRAVAVGSRGGIDPIYPAEDELIEDAGLFESDLAPETGAVPLNLGKVKSRGRDGHGA